MISGSSLYPLHKDVGLLIRYYVVWHSIPVEQSEILWRLVNGVDYNSEVREGKLIPRIGIHWEDGQLAFAVLKEPNAVNFSQGSELVLRNSVILGLSVGLHCW